MVNTNRNSLRIRARDLRGKGYTFIRIGEALGVSRKTASRLYNEGSYQYTAPQMASSFKSLGLQGPDMKILFLDIETSPNVAEVWDLWNQNINLNQLRKSTKMICWAAKWLGDKEVEFQSHYDNWGMLKRIWDLLDKADIVVHYYGKRFDIPHINREFIEAGLTPPSPYKQIDLLETVKKQFKFPSNKLAYVSKAVGLKGKTAHEGYSLWVKCENGDSEAWEKMKEYNIRDVILLEELYEKLRPWIVGHPNYGAVIEKDCCPACGNTNLIREGHAYTNTGKFQQYRCKDCSKWSRSNKRQGYAKVLNITL